MNDSVADPSTDTPTNNNDLQTVTLLPTEKGNISVVHDITLGDLLISTILMAILIFMVLSRLIKR